MIRLDDFSQATPEFADSTTIEPMTRFPGTECRSWIRLYIAEKVMLHTQHTKDPEV